MGKQSTSSIREELRKKLQKEFDRKNETLVENLTNTKTLLNKSETAQQRLRQENARLYEENEQLKEKVQAYEDQIRRLLEYMDMPEDEREKAFKEYQTHIKNEQALANMSKFISQTMNLFI